MAESKLCDLSTDFAVRIIKLCETIKGHPSLTNQLERSATSIGAIKLPRLYASGVYAYTDIVKVAQNSDVTETLSPLNTQPYYLLFGNIML